jgi:hypothetical protein
MFAGVGTRTHVRRGVRLPFVAALMLLMLTALARPANAAPPGVASTIGTGPPVFLESSDGTVFRGLTITPAGTSATITFTTNQAVRAGASYAIAGNTAPVAPIVNASVAAQPITGAAPTTRTSLVNGAAFTGFVTLPSTSHTIKLTGLKSNTAYTANVWIDNGAGQQRQSADLTFHTPKQRIRITFPKATITDYAQLIGSPDALWILNVKWTGGELGTCYPYSGTLCQPGDTGNADNFNQYVFTNAQNQAVGYLFREEDFGNALPTAFTVGGDAQASSWHSLPNGNFEAACPDPLGCPDDPYVWQVPQGGESATQTVNVRAEDHDFGFKSIVQVKFEVFYDDLSYAGSKTVADAVGGRTVVSLFT